MALLVAGTTAPLAPALRDAAGLDAARLEVRRFPDGEAYVRLVDDVAGQDIVVVQSTRSDADAIELLLLHDALAGAGAASITTVIPYFGYARQDRAFQPGEAVSSRALARAIGAGTGRVVTVDPHKAEVLSSFPCPATAASAVDALADALLDAEAVLAPDRGARARAEQAAARIGCPVDHLEKTRLGPRDVRVRAKDLDVADKRVVILDDMIASGGTMCEAAKQLLAQGAAEVWAACTHGLFTDGAVARLQDAGFRRIVCADTLPTHGCEVVSAAPAVAAALAPQARRRTT